MYNSDAGGNFHYLTDGSGPSSQVLSDGAAVYSDGLSEHRGGMSTFYSGDLLGSVTDTTNSSGGGTTAHTEYDAFGNVVATSGSTASPFAYCGKQGYQTDSGSGLMLLGNRFYDASVGRFVSRDPAGAGDNGYAYCGNNPVSNTARSLPMASGRGAGTKQALYKGIVHETDEPLAPLLDFVRNAPKFGGNTPIVVAGDNGPEPGVLPPGDAPSRKTSDLSGFS